MGEQETKEVVVDGEKERRRMVLVVFLCRRSHFDMVQNSHVWLYHG